VFFFFFCEGVFFFFFFVLVWVGGGGGGLRVFNSIVSYGFLHYFYVGKTHLICTMFLLSVNILGTISS